MPTGLLKDGAVYKMLYRGYDGANNRLYYASSSDGLTWRKRNNAIPSTSDTTSTDGRIPLGTNTTGDDAGLTRSGMLKEGSTYKIWYGGSDGTNYRGYYATLSAGVTSAGALSAGWHHLAVTNSSGTLKLYVDGSLAASGSTSVTGVTNTADLLFGDLFDGVIDEMRIYKRVLTEAEIRQGMLGLEPGEF